MTIRDTIDYEHNAECDWEGSNEMANSHIPVSLALELLSYARFTGCHKSDIAAWGWGVEARDGSIIRGFRE